MCTYFIKISISKLKRNLYCLTISHLVRFKDCKNKSCLLIAKVHHCKHSLITVNFNKQAKKDFIYKDDIPLTKCLLYTQVLSAEWG